MRQRILVAALAAAALQFGVSAAHAQASPGTSGSAASKPMNDNQTGTARPPSAPATGGARASENMPSDKAHGGMSKDKSQGTMDRSQRSSSSTTGGMRSDGTSGSVAGNPAQKENNQTNTARPPVTPQTSGAGTK